MRLCGGLFKRRRCNTCIIIIIKTNQTDTVLTSDHCLNFRYWDWTYPILSGRLHDGCIPTRVAGLNVTGQNIADNMLYWQNVIGQNAVENMLSRKCCGQNVLTFWPIKFCPHNILFTTLCPWHFVRWHFVLEPLQAIYMRHANVSLASPSDPHFSIWLSFEPPFQSPNFRGGCLTHTRDDSYSNCSTKIFSELMWINSQ